MKIKNIIFIHIIIMYSFSIFAQNTSVKIGLLKYKGGGDWYANPTSLPNLVKFCNTELKTNINPEISTVEIGSSEIFDYPFMHMTGHGNVFFSNSEAENLRNYLLAGGFLHIDDNYGLNEFIRREMKKVFPDNNFVELPANHEIYRQAFVFEKGLPKIHEHDNKPAQAFGIFIENRLVCLYTYECDLGDGWEDTDVHNDSKTTHEKALKMGANIIAYVFKK